MSRPGPDSVRRPPVERRLAPAAVGAPSRSAAWSLVCLLVLVVPVAFAGAPELEARSATAQSEHVVERGIAHAAGPRRARSLRRDERPCAAVEAPTSRRFSRPPVRAPDAR